MSKKPSSNSAELARLQARLGYTFHNIELLQLALTHKSFAKANNERLEFIGDAVLGYVIGVGLYRRDSALREDALSLMRAKLVRGSTLAEIARELDLGACIKIGSGEMKSGGRDRDSILADALEALIGAVHEDSHAEHGVAVVERVLGVLFAQRLATLSATDLKDPKTLLQEYLQRRQLPLPSYRVVATAGLDHKRVYTVECAVIALQVFCQASASSRRNAEKASAEAVLQQLHGAPDVGQNTGGSAGTSAGISGGINDVQDSGTMD